MRRGLNRCKRRETDPFKRMGRKKSVERGAEVRSSFHDNHLRRMYATYLINFPLREERVSRRYPRWPRIKIDRVFIRVFRKCKLIRDDAPFLFFSFLLFGTIERVSVTGRGADISHGERQGTSDASYRSDGIGSGFEVENIPYPVALEFI